MNNIGVRLQTAMSKKGIDQKELALDLEISQPSISKIINGKQFLDFDLAIKACEILDISLDWLAYGRETAKNPVYYSNPERQRIEYLMSILQETDYEPVIVALEGIIEIKMKGSRAGNVDMAAESPGVGYGGSNTENQKNEKMA